MSEYCIYLKMPLISASGLFTVMAEVNQYSWYVALLRATY